MLVTNIKQIFRQLNVKLDIIYKILSKELKVISLTIEDKKIEDIFLKEFHSDKKKFFNFIQSSFEKLQTKNVVNNEDSNLANLQIDSMSKTWSNDKDKVWDEL